MEKIRGALDVELTVEEVTLINTLIERDTPKAVVKSDWESSEGKTYTSYKCPECDNSIAKSDKFCDQCGQRLDRDNIAL